MPGGGCTLHGLSRPWTRGVAAGDALPGAVPAAGHRCPRSVSGTALSAGAEAARPELGLAGGHCPFSPQNLGPAQWAESGRAKRRVACSHQCFPGNWSLCLDVRCVSLAACKPGRGEQPCLPVWAVPQGRMLCPKDPMWPLREQPNGRGHWAQLGSALRGQRQGTEGKLRPLPSCETPRDRKQGGWHLWSGWACARVRLAAGRQERAWAHGEQCRPSSQHHGCSWEDTAS